MFGVGFLTADRIARGLGCSPQDPERARAGVLHLLAEAERSGSTCMPVDALLSALTELLGDARPEALIDELVGSGDLSRTGRWIYRRETAELEAELAERIVELVRAAPSDRLGAAARGGRQAPRASSPPPSSSRAFGTRSHTGCR